MTTESQFSDSVKTATTSESLSSYEQSQASPQEVLRLRQQSSRLEHLLEVMPAGVIVIDGRGIVRQANQVAVELLGEPLEEQSWRTIIARAFKPQADDGHEVSLQDGRKVQFSISPLELEPGQLIVITDLTHTRRLQQQISHMRNLSSLGRMVASLAHQIRTPLSSAMLYGANLQNPTLNPDSRNQFADKLMARLKDLEQQVNDMLLFAKSGEQQVVAELSLQSLMLEVEAGSEAMLVQRQASLTLDLPEPDILVMGNKTALASALQNLIHNSLQANPLGCQIEIAASRDARNPEQVRLSVSDNGPGIPEGKCQSIFDPFYTSKSQGTGLGLAVVKSVAQSHQGSVRATNNPRGGARVEMLLPIYREEQNYSLLSAGGGNL
ncbi:sensor histidine kinase [Lacimicrobium alkaliphilum]|uniref:histidine kinase n=1 Tax=Lacimicrobium alkaliphilum TaxID=1526571 RepID=A0ABQ1RLU6_9ALTE|nr:PAS domain-containing sensor histidine kinase [Lacimicrobium alkaliphilum]GGD72589.1 sensor histidine kinase [Lacimicrobium alkaliphilum]